MTIKTFMNMKKFLTFILAASLMMAAGEKASAQAYWTAAGGFTTFSLSGADSKAFDVPSVPGFYFGVNLDYAFSPIDNLTVEPGAYIMHYGREFTILPGVIEAKSRPYHANYIRIPVNLKYTFDSGSNAEFSVFTGPRFNFGIGGNMFDKDYSALKLSDAQWGLGASVLIADAVMVRGGYDFGLTRCVKDNNPFGEENLKVYRNTFYIGIGFAF